LATWCVRKAKEIQQKGCNCTTGTATLMMVELRQADGLCEAGPNAFYSRTAALLRKAFFKKLASISPITVMATVTLIAIFFFF
jgi:hypothetical protein